MNGKFCFLPESEAFKLGIGGLVCLIMAQIIGSTLIYHSYWPKEHRKSCSVKKPLLSIALLISWSVILSSYYSSLPFSSMYFSLYITWWGKSNWSRNWKSISKLMRYSLGQSWINFLRVFLIFKYCRVKRIYMCDLLLIPHTYFSKLYLFGLIFKSDYQVIR